MKRKQLFSEKNKWERGTLMIEDGICLVENGEGDILLAESLGNAAVFIKLDGKWQPARIQGDTAEVDSGGTIVLSGGEAIRYEKAVKRPLLALLDSLDDETFLLFLKHLHGFGLSVFDCVFSYNQAMFSGEGVSFYHFSADDAQCALQHHRGSSGKNDRFEWTASDGRRSIMYSTAKHGGTA
ncbi:hypothetical protein AXI59_07210 [Bacillus nakamurai]|uniref:DUF2777 domain-containing protein n=1 Tax=Bacillus nakamurai TaxID=1793963 RepID=A0A150F6N5_9BACI|nr:DUF2777 family protein [Bacillus nakamurai]KXZ18850.1 hypothetical protein AXI58_15980 [Bacillus nakamurai]KXZ24093.1 hypothetical protein AXI59_07210 [Bacillus nakamurai]MED1226069.1 DUF2777 family protein [Bacillus nakamurai]